MNKCQVQWRCQAFLGWPLIPWLQPAPALHLPAGQALVQRSFSGGSTSHPGGEITPSPREAPTPFPGAGGARGRRLGWQTAKCWQLWKPVQVQACGLNHRPNLRTKEGERACLLSCRSLGERRRRGCQEWYQLLILP